MVYALFTDAAKAAAHRAQFGGWLAEDARGLVHWFDLGHTASDVMTHPAACGQTLRLY